MRFFSLYILILTLTSLGCFVFSRQTPESLFEKAKHYESENDFNNAVQYLTKAIEKNPDYTDAYYRRADINLRRDSFERAIMDYNYLISVPNLSIDKKSELYFLRGSAHYLNLRDDLACKDWDFACENLGHNKSCTQKRKHCKK